MKQKLSLALALALTLSLAACGNQTGSDGSTPSAVNPPDTPTVSSAVTPESSENVEPSDTAPAPVDGEENGILIAYFGVPETDGTTTAADVMVHRTDMVLLDAESTAEEVLKTIEESGLSRFPVYGEDSDDIIGILSTRDYLLNTQRPQPKAIRELLRQPYFIPETVRTDKLFRDMQERKVHMAIVVDEYGGTAGLVTMEDLLEEIVGNIYDEFDLAEEQEIIPLAEDRWRVAGGVELEELEEVLGLTFPEEVEEDYDTLGGLIFAHLDVIPEDGSQLDLDLEGLHIHVDSIAERRVEWCTVTKLKSDPMDVLTSPEE